MFSCYFHVSHPAAVSSQVHHFQVYLAGKNLCDSCIRLHHCVLPQELLHRCVLVVLKLTNRKERRFCLFVHCGFSCLVSSSCQCLQHSVSSSTVAKRLSKEDDCIAVHFWYPRQWNLVCRWCHLLLFGLQTTFVCRDTKEWCVFLDLVFTYRYTYIHNFYLYLWNPPICIYIYNRHVVSSGAYPQWASHGNCSRKH